MVRFDISRPIRHSVLPLNIILKAYFIVGYNVFFNIIENVHFVGDHASIFYVKSNRKTFDSFGANGDYSRPSGRMLLSTLVDITSCNDVSKTASFRCQNK